MRSANYTMFFLLQELRKQSKCADKQVSCILTDDADNILSVGINNVTSCSNCTNTGNKKGCVVTHAEVDALSKLSKNNAKLVKKAYVSLYPCENCQNALAMLGIKIVVFGYKHKDLVIPGEDIIMIPNLVEELPNINGEQKQLSVIISELAELIKVISDFFYRSHERDVSIDDILDEIIDVRLMTNVLLTILSKSYDEKVLFKLMEQEKQKLDKILGKLVDGTIQPGSPYS